MGWSQTQRVLLVWPARGRILTRQLDLVLIQRHSRNLGAQLALVTDDAEVKFNAQQLGIQTFDSIHQAQETRWRRSGSNQPSRIHYQIEKSARYLPGQMLRYDPKRPLRKPVTLLPVLRLGFFGLGVIALISIVAIFLPSAQIGLYPRLHVQEITIPVQASTSTEEVGISGMLPIHMISAIVEGRDSLPTTGNVLIPERYAAGRVTFTNLTDQSVTIPAGTVVSSPESGIRLTTNQIGKMPAGPGRTLSLPVTALMPGSAANLPAGHIRAIEGSLGVKLMVTNPEPISGGNEVLTQAPTVLDQDRIYNQLIAALRENALVEIEERTDPDDLLLAPLPSLSRTLEESYDPPELQPGSQISLALRQEFRAPVVSGDDLYSLVVSLLDANLPDGYQGLPNTVEIEHLTKPVLLEDGTARWELRARRTIQAQLAPDQAIQLALGNSKAEAHQRLMENLALSKPPDIHLHPSWWPLTPFLPFRISVLIIQ